MTGIMMHHMSHKSGPASANLVYNLDAANFSGSGPGGSAQFNGTNYLSSSVPFSMGTGAYTVEAFVYLTATASNACILGATVAGGSSGFSLAINNMTTIQVDRSGFAANQYTVPTMTLNTWHHIVATRNSSNQETVFVDGVKSSTGYGATQNFTGSTGYVGSFGGSAWAFTGYISQLRAVVGSNVYDPTQSTITVPTSTLASVTNTKLLLLFASSAALLTDTSGTQTMTNTGTVTYNSATAVTSAVVNYAGLSASFNGSSQYLSATNAAFTFAGDFTVEGWYRPTSVTGLRTLFTIGAPTAATGAMVVYSNGGTLQAQPYGGGNITFSGATMSTNTWYHVALVRSGSTIKLYFNGTANATTSTNSSSIGNGAFTVGFLSGGYGYFAGNVSNVRVSNSAVYTGNFTPSTSALTTTANTVALLPLTATPFADISTSAITVTNTGTTSVALQYPFTLTDATGTYTLTTSNANSNISWNSANGGVFRSTYIGDAMGDYIKGGPNYNNGNQSYTVFIAYKLATSSTGRLINTGDETNGDFVMGGYNGKPKVYYSNGVSINLSGATADTVWHLDWAVFDKTTTVGSIYSATNTQPTTYAYTATNAGIKGFNQLRLFNRASGTEAHPADVGVIKVWDGALTLAQIQNEYAVYKARFGY